MTPSPAAPYMTYFTRYAVPSPCPSRRVRAEEAEYTITAPPARRQNVAVRSSRCSSGCCLGGLAIRAGFDRTRRTPPGGAPDASRRRGERFPVVVTARRIWGPGGIYRVRGGWAPVNAGRLRDSGARPALTAIGRERRSPSRFGARPALTATWAVHAGRLRDSVPDRRRRRHGP